MARSSRGSSDTAFRIALAMAVAASCAVSAHRLDEYLQATKLDIDLTRVELQLELTPGVDVADAVIADIDRDRNGVLSAGEQSAYAGRVLKAIELELDGAPLGIHLTSSSFPELESLRGGEGIIQLRLTAALARQDPATHHLFFRNTHRRDMAVYLANALVPGNARIEITAQRHDTTQSELAIDYVVHSRRTSRLAWLLGGLTGTLMIGLGLLTLRRSAVPQLW
jgi:hypothetical protein